jgi:hypothetical protein
MTDAGRNPAAYRAPPRPDRIRVVERGFAFVPNRFLHDGFFAHLSHVERSLYLFLVLASDRNGVSYYGYERICSTLELTPDELVQTRNSLIDQDLIAFDGSRFQVLSLPPTPVVRHRRPLTTVQDFEEHDPLTVRQLIRSSLDRR